MSARDGWQKFRLLHMVASQVFFFCLEFQENSSNQLAVISHHICPEKNLQAAAVMLYTQVCLCQGSSARNFCFVFIVSVHPIAGVVSVFSIERGPTQPRHARLGTFPAVHEAIAVWAVPFAADARAHLPRRQA